MGALSVSVLGPLRITLGERPLDRFRSRNVPALLIYLVVEAALNTHAAPRRETLMHLLWPESRFLAVRVRRFLDLAVDVLAPDGELVWD